MIATILPGSPNFHAVGYNERKVSMGVARLIEIQNFGTIGNFGKPTPDEMVSFLKAYSSRNGRIQKPQFHVAFSCKGHEIKRRAQGKDGQHIGQCRQSCGGRQISSGGKGKR